jgi:uncharacterized protein (DUF3084 family)
MIASAKPTPAMLSISGLARLATRAILVAACSTSLTLAAKRARISSSSVNDLTMRIPCNVSCRVSRMRAPPLN